MLPIYTYNYITCFLFCALEYSNNYVYTVFLGVFSHMLKKFAKNGVQILLYIYIFFVFVIFCTLKICSQQTKPSIISA